MIKKDKIFRTGAFLSIVILAGICGYFVGSGHIFPLQIKEQQVEDDENSERRIAVVDMDEGVKQDGETIQYASKILPYSDVDYTVTGLQDARNGVATGLYSAYVIIPSDFSKSVYSINGQPVESSLAYTIDDKMDDAKKERTARQIAAMAQNMNNSLTKVYLSSVMKEFHSAQDATGTIIKNDEKDAELLESVDAGNLIELVELPQTAEVENNVTSLDLKEQYESNAKLVDSLGTTYQEFLQNGQSDINKTKARSEEALTKIDEAYGALAEGNKRLSEFVVSTLDMEEQYDNVKAELEKAIKDYDEYVERYNEANAGGNKTALIEALKEYESAETKYQDMLKPYLADNKKEYEFADLKKFTAELSERIEKKFGEEVLESAGETSWKAVLEALSDDIKTSAYMTSQPAIGNCTKGEDISDEGQTTESPEVKTLNEALGDNAEEMSTASRIRKQSETLISLSRQGQDEIIQDFKAKKEALNGTFKEIENQYQAAGKAEREVYDELNAYNLTAYVENGKVDQIAGSLQANNQEIEQKVAEHTEESDKYVDDVYEAASDNIEAMQKSVEEAQEKSEKRLQEGLKEAKESRNKNKDMNEKLLKEMTGKLAYTRIGDMENKEVYDFIAAPLALSENPADQEASLKAEEMSVASAAEVKSQTQSNKKAVWWIVLLLTGGIGAAVIARQILAVWRRRRAEEF